MKLTEYQQLQSNGARDAVLFEINNTMFLAIPQLAEDIDSNPPNMNGGNSNVAVLIYQWRNDRFHEYQKINAHGNEHASFYELNGRYFLAIACIRSGEQPNFEMHVPSMIYEWKDNAFVEFQTIDTFAAKSCLFFTVNETLYLGFSESVKEPGNDDNEQNYSHLYCWNGHSFEKFQALPSTWGYELTAFQINNRHFLAIADNLEASVIYEWNGEKFEAFQKIAEQGGGRHFCHFKHNKKYYLAFANLLHESAFYQWNGKEFVELQVLEGVAGRSFHTFEKENETYIFRTNYIAGSREEPITELDSTVYQFDNEKLKPIASYKTYGGTTATTFENNGRMFLIVANSLSKEVRFKTPTIVYEITL